MMYKISDFSKITGLTVKALRYYDEQCLLTPSYRCSETSYRFYNDNDFKRAMLIKLLRTLDFSISEIKDVLSNYESDCSGNHFNCYYDNECKEVADIELCLPVKRQICSKDAEYKTIPAIKQFQLPI